ncbi:prolyl oligopeptidase family serine peptidase [Algoriphagus sp. PAP.12]|uniref:prolyl oligopeptidase family serine peptidase n=1 Tax=Algoriphagus sp. PAP.12 TaxID=2996678 RepID=UPI00227D6B7F|nr:prolyl oligopeptidase family serine peptidase [Algoriphagus sp. PAP.12]
MKKITLFLALLLAFQFTWAEVINEDFDPNREYKLVVEGFDWGPAVSKVILRNEQEIKDFSPTDFKVFATRSTDEGEIPASQTNGERNVVFAYTSDADGNRVEAGMFITLVLEVSPILPIGSPFQYMRSGGRGGNFWVNYSLTIVHKKNNQVWDQKIGKKMPLVDDYDLNGKFSNGSITMSYAAFTPKSIQAKVPLIIWLHGGGEGGTDPTIPLLGNRAANYASPEIQALFGESGAYVLAPQAPTFWMQAADGMTRGNAEDIYHEALFALFEDFVAKNPQIDTNRIYVGGCSNGGYMSLKLILEHPDYFAAGYISALAYSNEFVSDEQVKSIKNVPIWFVHSEDDGTTKPDETVVPLYHRLKDAGAKSVHFSYYKHVTDITGFYGGEDYYYPGHWSWIYSHANKARLDFDGKQVYSEDRPVTIMEWLSEQEK